MLVEVDSKLYKHYFSADPHSFINESFIELNKGKAERVIRLVEDSSKKDIGFTVGLRKGILLSPFSAPFGGFHFRNEIIYISEIENFVNSLKNYVIFCGLKGVKITLPPNIYHRSFNAKTINALIRSGFRQNIPEITSWIDLRNFGGNFKEKNSRKYLRQAVRNGLMIELATDSREKEVIYDLICCNRAKYGRPIYMTFNDIIQTGALWPIDFFKVCLPDKSIIASAIFYRNHPTIVYAAFWGDSNIGRPLRAIDFLSFNLWNYYRSNGFHYIDMGISTESGTPNEGLLRFKETHDATSSIRWTFDWNV